MDLISALKNLGMGAKKSQRGAREMARQLEALAALPEALGLVPSTYIGQLTGTYSYSFRGFDTIVWLLRTLLHVCVCTHTCMHTDTNK